jgi:excisionase family DNA binding protein
MRAKTQPRLFDLAHRALSENLKPGESEPSPSVPTSEFIDARAAAFWLGIPLRSFHQYVQKGFLPSYKLGRHRLFRKKELLAALSINRTASRDEVLF